MFSWRALLPLVLTVTMVAAVACGGDGGQDAEQVLNVNLGAEPGSLDPQRATDAVSISVLRNIYSGLLRPNADLEVIPDLAEGVPTLENGGISPDGLTYTFTLREGLTWNDGSPLVAQAFVDGARHLFEPGSQNYYVDFYRVIAAPGPDGDANQAVVRALAEGAQGDELAALEQAVVDNLQVSAPDDRTVVYELSRPSPVFPLLASMWPLYPIRQDVLDAHGDAWTEAGTLVSNGPFRLAEWRHNEDIRLERNEHWHHADDVTLAAVNMDMIADTAVSFAAYQTGELDMVILGPVELVQVRGTALEDEFTAYPQLATLGAYFNVADPVLASTEVRQALAGAFDRREYAEIVREGAVLPAFGWIPPGQPGHDEELGRQFDDNVERAQELLQESGHEGAEITILSAQSNVSIQMAEWLKEQWERNLDLTVTINVLETATYFEERNAGNWQVVLGGWGADYPDPHNWMPLFVTGNGLNAGQYSNAEYDRLVEQAELELDNERRLDLYAQTQEILIDEAGFSPMYYDRRNVLVKPWIQGLTTASKEGQIPGDLFLHSIVVSGRE